MGKIFVRQTKKRHGFKKPDTTDYHINSIGGHLLAGELLVELVNGI